MDEYRSHGPAAPDAARWQTFRPERTVLAVARTLTSAIRLLEATAVFLGDPRVQVVFTVHAASRFSADVVELLRARCARLVPWESVGELRYDLVITASEKVDLTRVTAAPILVLPHGIGFHKYVPEVDSANTRLSGLVSEEVLADPRVTLAITHPAQAEQLAAASPRTVGRTTLIGDLSHDAMVGSTARRERYRESLGVSPDHRLVAVSSTWGTRSLLGGRPELLDRLLAELPVDEYRVAAIVHPNVWTWHGGWQLGQWCDSALRAGLRLLPPTSGWHATLVAADVLIGDHGSVSLYGAALGTPLLLGAFGDEVVPDTPLAELGGRADRLDPTQGLREQLDKAIATHDPRRFRQLTGRIFAAPGRGVDLLRMRCYGLLNLAEPDHEPILDAAPDPVPVVRPVCSFEVFATLVAPTTLSLHRIPASVRGNRPALPASDSRHLLVGSDEPNLRLFADAAVVVRAPGPQASDRRSAEGWLTETLRRHPGARIAATAVDEGCHIALRDGRCLLLTGAPRIDPRLAASAAYSMLVAGRLDAGAVELRVAAMTYRLRWQRC
ncbi:hypothetical protein [Actinoalloteichus hymeniacidonis]|uniref:Uncharacterized protein n=1 Tax=Actinoalloteichus hymeniacidonis TaxID=340345 RepID=A0AAC9HSC6_9PSEU|nr:hypothetical protein [Actinoalloteichus hymeniacidonis]AOS64271.1 hypothetical protein TL08_17355 [Actinoalloteichus hymeniacidonis]MBB5907661.1 hypothetical protein [Actinoalloteichus hymeniacidonis]